MRLILSLVRLVAGLWVLGAAVPAILALFGFAVPFLDLFNHLQFLLFWGTVTGVVLAIVLALPRVWIGVALIGFVASCWTYLPEWASSLAPRPSRGDATVLKLMTHNIFGLNYDMQRLADAIAAEKPDIVALQEYFPQQAAELGRLLEPTYPYAVHCFGGKRANLALYSRLPFKTEMSAADCPATAFGTQRTAHILVGFTLADGTQFSVMTTHMDWPYPIARQQAEFRTAIDVVKNTTGPLILVGDFNSTPWSYALRQFESDSGLRRETRNLITYPMLFTLGDLVHTWPFLALDQVFERGVAVHELHRGGETGSDHLPVIFSFSIPN